MTGDYNLHSLTGEEEAAAVQPSLLWCLTQSSFSQQNTTVYPTCCHCVQKLWLIRLGNWTSTNGYIFRVTTGHMKKPLLVIQTDNENFLYHCVILSCMNLLYIWLFLLLDEERDILRSQLTGFPPVWTLICTFRRNCRDNNFWHSEQLKRFSPAWTLVYFVFSLDVLNEM